MNELKNKLKVIYTFHKKYIDITFALIVIAFLYAVKRGDLQVMVSVLNVCNEVLKVLLNV